VGPVEPPAEAERPLAALGALLRDPAAPVSPKSAKVAEAVHIGDSLSGLELEPVRSAGRIADVGAGAGLPGLVLAAALPGARVDLVESVERKCEFMRRAVAEMELENAAVVCARAEAWSAGEGLEAYDAVTARAVGGLATLAELASPLLAEGGVLAAWKGRRDDAEEASLARALPRLALDTVEVRPVTPYPGSRDRHIHLLRKNGPTPEDLPRRDGLAAKRPFGGE
jgi:16S rRNA (guanine527-N7)-methyltransferase